ncbi:MAG: glycosyltransferase family 4 protein [Lachnospiraceae bacterium]|nr:glycosyltransferase family 4 protein [Lachnospiraceae bacterium]
MNILYLTLKNPVLTEAGIYPDLINALTAAGHKVTIAFADSPANTPQTKIVTECGVRILKVASGEIFGVGFIKKGINTLKLEPKLKSAIKAFLKDESFDMVLYATPPVTFANVVRFCKKTYGCRAFLMLKDIFPQNAVDIGLFSKGGPIHKYFRLKEKNLYALSDVIGCMSEGNIRYLKQHDPEIPEDKMILFPNTINPPADEGDGQVSKGSAISGEEHGAKEGTEPESGNNKKLRLIFGGNLGKPQAIGYLMDVIRYDRSPIYDKVEFLFVGNGSEAALVKRVCDECDNATFYDFMKPDEYDRLMSSCDVGIVSLDARFTIPNYPSRMLSYMAMKKPMIACTDPNTDVKELLTKEANCGLWCRSDDVKGFWDCIEELIDDDRRKILGQNGRKYLEENFNVTRSVEIIEQYG